MLLVYNDRSVPRLDEILAHERAVRAIAQRLLADGNSVDDVVQETWIRALRQGPPKPRSLRAWLVTVARNVARNIRRSDIRRRRREEAVARPEGVRSGDAYEQRELDRRVVAAVLRLHEPYRSAVLLRFYRGWTLAAIARDSGVSSTAVRKRLARAFVLLRESLDPAERETDKNWRLREPDESPVAS